MPTFPAVSLITVVSKLAAVEYWASTWSALIPTFGLYLPLPSFCAKALIFISFWFVIFESIFTNIPKAFEILSCKLIFPLFTAFPEARLTLLDTVASAINAIAAELSALSAKSPFVEFGFFLSVITPVVSFIISASESVWEFRRIP